MVLLTHLGLFAPSVTNRMSDLVAGVCQNTLPVVVRDTNQWAEEVLPKFQNNSSKEGIENVLALINGSIYTQCKSGGGQLAANIDEIVVETVYEIDEEDDSYSLPSLLLRNRYNSDDDSLSVDSIEKD